MLAHMVMLTLRETAAELRLGSTKTWQLAATGELEVCRIGRRVLVPRRSLDAYIAAHLEGGNESASTGQNPVRARRAGGASARARG